MYKCLGWSCGWQGFEPRQVKIWTSTNTIPELSVDIPITLCCPNCGYYVEKGGLNVSRNYYTNWCYSRYGFCV